MSYNVDNIAVNDSATIAVVDGARIIDVGFTNDSFKNVKTFGNTMPALGSKEFEDLSKTLDTRPMGYRVVKRAFDIVMSVVVLAFLLLLWPITLAVLIVVAVQTKAFPIFVQERIGQHGKTIRVPKIRTMVADSENVQKYLNVVQLDEWRKERKVTDDPRVVPMGAFLRKTSLDELSNFALVLTGKMSVVGPRPIVADETAWYGSNLPKVLSVPQGVTGWWQCKARNSASFESGKRQQLELEYADIASYKVDATVFFSTFGVMFGSDRSGR